MTSHTSADFRNDFARLPKDVQRRAREAYRLFEQNPKPRSEVQKTAPFDDIWSVRITGSYRAIGRLRGNAIVWFFIGSHADYDKMIARL